MVQHQVEIETVGLTDMTYQVVVTGLGPAKRAQCIVGAGGRSRDRLERQPLE